VKPQEKRLLISRGCVKIKFMQEIQEIKLQLEVSRAANRKLLKEIQVLTDENSILQNEIDNLKKSKPKQ